MEFLPNEDVEQCDVPKRELIQDEVALFFICREIISENGTSNPRSQSCGRVGKVV